MKTLKFAFILFLIGLSFTTCKKRTTVVQDVHKYNAYVSRFPEKRISTTSNLSFVLQKTPNITEVSNDLISISPAVKGDVVLDNNTISFVPKEKLKSNTEYSLTLHLSKLYADVPKDLKEFSIVVKTKELLFSVALDSPMLYNKDFNYVEGTLNASDVFDNTNLPRMIWAEYEGKAFPISFSTTEGVSSRVVFKIDSLPRRDEDKNLLVTWTGKSIGSTSKGETQISIVGKSSFKVLDVRVIDKSKQEIEISFSDPISTSQNLKGLIQFLNTEKQKYTYRIQGNIIRVFPKASFQEKVDIEVFSGIKNTEGFTLKNNFSKTLFFEQPKPTISFVKSGTILPNSDNLKINFNSTNLRAVDVTVFKIYKDNILQFLQNNNLNTTGNLRYVGRPEARYTINLSNQGLDLQKSNAFAVNLSDLVVVEEGGMYRVEVSYKKEYSNYSCDGKTPDNAIVFGKKEMDATSYDKVNNYGGYYDDYYYNDYDWNERDNPCHSSYYGSDTSISTNVLATNLGVIVKEGNNNTTFIAVTDILTTQPVSGAQVTLYNLQQQELISQATNGDGIATFTTQDKAFFALVTDGKNTTYVRLDDGNALSMSKFDVSGTRLQEGIQGFIYGERGVWRPGDAMYLTFVLNDNANPIPEKHPIKFELINPQGKIIDRNIQYKNTNNVYAYAPTTDQEAITGNYKLCVSVGGATFNKTLKVETIKPNRLKIKLDTHSDLIKANTNISGTVDVKWLHGAIARGLKLDINGKFRGSKTSFKGFDNYEFDDVTRSFSSEEFKVLKGNLNNEGKTSFSVRPQLESKAPGMIKASFITKVYENGGDFSTDVFTQKVSPYTSYVGLNAADEKQSNNYLFTDSDYTFNVVSLSENGNPIANNLDVKVYKLNWRWWWRNSDDGLSNYDGSVAHDAYTETSVRTSGSGRGSFNLKVDKNDWGRYLVKVRDRKSGHSTSKVVYFDWPSWYGQKRGSQDKSNATMLVFTTDKEKYNVNENATVKFPSSEGGRALITIENGTEVLDSFWVSTEKEQTSFDFPVLSNYAPNVFVNISLLQEHSQTMNDLPIRMYGSVPMLVSDPTTELHPEVQLAEELKPEQKATIRVKEKDGKPMTYTIALVDEGLLDLTRFKTPNPYDVFYARQSLGVKTWDIFDDVVGAYGGKINQILSIGGDEAEAASKNKKANRFKPMVTYLGPFDLPAGKMKDHEITIPKYIGSVKAMVVASDATNNAYGATEKIAFVRKPVMLLASLPRKITPSETVTLPVNVFAMKPNIKNVTVTVQSNPAYTIEGGNSQTISFAQPDEKMAYFKLKVNDFKGIGKVQIDAVSGSEKASYEVEIDVLNPNPVTTETTDLVLQANEKSSLNFATFGTKGSNVATIELSSLPPMNFTKRLEYLIRYPHGCVEQTTSSAFPQLYFSEIFELSDKKKSSIDRNIKATIKRLSDFQKSNGGLSYWQGGSSYSDWGTSYAGHFMIEASKKGYALPIGFKNKWISYQKDISRNWRKSSSYDKGLSQAYRLYTLSLAGSPDMASMNRLRETNGLSNDAKLRLASAYALSGKQSVAKQIISTLGAENYYRPYYAHYGSEDRNKAMALETYTLLNDQTKSIKLAKEIAERLSSSRWMSTQTTSYALVAMSNYALKNGGVNGINVTYQLNGSSKNVGTSKAFFTSDLEGIKAQNTLEVNNKNNGVVYVRLFNKGILPVGEEKLIQSNLTASVSYKTKEGSSISIDNLTQGTNFVAEVRVTNDTNKRVENVALTQYFPSGWEIVNTRFTDFGENTESSKADFTDIRDDSLSNYFTLKPKASKMFRVLLNASYLGDYYLPGVQAEAMYDNEYLVRTQGRWIKVVK